jgi:hypothetical protein
MIAHSLQVGNFVSLSQDKIEPKQILGLTLNKVLIFSDEENENVWIPIEDIYPIAITQRILENMGFIKSIYHTWVWEFGEISINQQLEMAVNFNRKPIYDKDKGVHLLQNLIFRQSGNPAAVTIETILK